MKAILVGLGGRGRYWLGQCLQQADIEVAACVEPFAQNRQCAIEDHDISAERIHDDLAHWSDTPQTTHVKTHDFSSRRWCGLESMKQHPKNYIPQLVIAD